MTMNIFLLRYMEKDGENGQKARPIQCIFSMTIESYMIQGVMVVSSIKFQFFS